MRVTVVVSTYNRPRALDRVLHGLAQQRTAPAEVLVADDGSTEQTRRLVERWRAMARSPLRHVWHEDRGFRLAAIRNRAAAVASGDWLVFLDGDCVPRPSFVERTIRFAARGSVLAGDRILLSEELTREIEQGELAAHRWPLARWARERARGRINRLAPLAFWPSLAGRSFRASDWRHLRGANIGVAREDFERVNGFEENFVGWGLEDSDFAVRLINAGIGIRSARFALAVLHLWHPEASRSAQQGNRELLEQAIAERRCRALVGLDQAGRGDPSTSVG